MYETYTVKQGDTLYGISNQFGVNVTDLAELNNIKGSNLPVGTILKIPMKSGVNPNNMFMYTVQKGDTLYSIARKYNTTVQAILDINYLKSNDLSVGQVLRLRVSDGEILECFGPDFEIPEEVVPSITYVVKAGDNLYNIAKKYNTSVSAINKLNNLTSNNLSVGQQLLIPTADIPNNSSSSSSRTYTVQKGDSLYSIARKFNTTVTDITRLNNLAGTSLSIGQQLLIPTSSNSSSDGSSEISNRTYTVQRGDSLYSIARKFNVSIDNIKRKNNLYSNLLSVGQTLII